MLSFHRDGKVFNYRVAGVAVRGDRVLLHRADTDDFWVLPGGRCEMLEPSAAALAREMSEELNARVEVGRLLWVVENFFEYGGCAHHELGLYFAMALPEDAAIVREPGPYFATDGAVKLCFEWHALDALPEAVYPSFLRQGLRRLPDGPQHLIHHG